LEASRCGRFNPEKINNLNGPGGPLPFKLPTKLLYAFLIPAMRATCPTHLVQLYCIILILHGISFITTPSTTALPHRKPASVGITRDSWGAQDDRRNALYILNTTNYEIINYILLFFISNFRRVLNVVCFLLGNSPNYPEESIQHTLIYPHTFFLCVSQHPISGLGLLTDNVTLHTWEDSSE